MHLFYQSWPINTIFMSYFIYLKFRQVVHVDAVVIPSVNARHAVRSAVSAARDVEASTAQSLNVDE